MPDSRLIGQRIKALREKKRLSQESLANLVGIAASTVCMYEMGERIPRDEIKVKLAKELGKSVFSIFFKE